MKYAVCDQYGVAQINEAPRNKPRRQLVVARGKLWSIQRKKIKFLTND